MPARVEIRGTEDFRRAAAKLKAAGNGKLTREMGKKMKVAAKPAVDDAQRSVRGLNSAGVRGGGGQQRREFALSKTRKVTERGRKRAFEGRGLRASIARAVQTQVRSGKRTAGVRIRVNKSRLPASQRSLPGHMNRGKWRHPVFGNTSRWVGQTTTPPGWFDRPMRKHGPKVRNGAVKAVKEITREIAG